MFVHTDAFTRTHWNLCTQHAFTHNQLLHREALRPLLWSPTFTVPLKYIWKLYHESIAETFWEVWTLQGCRAAWTALIFFTHEAPEIEERTAFSFVGRASDGETWFRASRGQRNGNMVDVEQHTRTVKLGDSRYPKQTILENMQNNLNRLENTQKHMKICEKRIW